MTHHQLLLIQAALVSFTAGALVMALRIRWVIARQFAELDAADKQEQSQ